MKINIKLTIPPSSTSRSSATMRIMFLALTHSEHLSRHVNKVRKTSRRPGAPVVSLLRRFLFVFVDRLELAMTVSFQSGSPVEVSLRAVLVAELHSLTV